MIGSEDFERAERLRVEAAEFRSRARAAYKASDLAAAESLYREALEIAREVGDSALVDLCASSRAGMAIEQEQGEAEIPFLLALLLRNPEPFTGFLAAYWAARHYELRKDFQKVAFYGNVALRYARIVNEDEPLGAAHDLVGNGLLAQGLLVEAAAEFEAAISAAGVATMAAAAFRVDLGYAQVLAGRPREGLANLLRSVRELRRSGGGRYLAQAHLDASSAYLDVGRSARARRHSQRAWELAQSLAWLSGQRNALYMMGQSAVQDGDVSAAQQHFQKLQESYYPNQPYLAGFLMTVDIRDLVNLHA